jgi:hypothetical protein
VTWLLVAVVVLGLPLLDFLADLPCWTPAAPKRPPRRPCAASWNSPTPCSTSSTPATGIRQGSVRSRPIPGGASGRQPGRGDLLGRRPAPATPPPGTSPSPGVALSRGEEFDHRPYPIWVTGEPATLPMARAGRPRRSCQGAGRTGAATKSVPAVPVQASPSSHPGTLVPVRPSGACCSRAASAWSGRRARTAPSCATCPSPAASAISAVLAPTGSPSASSRPC